MARVLVLLRHAKAAQDGASDETRPLTPRGVGDARAAGSWLADHDIRPDLVVVSSARRARETWVAATAAFVVAPPARIDPRIYDNTVEALLLVLNEADESLTTIVLVGHNPSIHELAVALDDGRGDPAARAAVHAGYPTAGIAVFDVGLVNGRLEPGGGSLRGFAVARS
jgi:phosphohistidine phosphatase